MNYPSNFRCMMELQILKSAPSIPASTSGATCCHARPVATVASIPSSVPERTCTCGQGRYNEPLLASSTASSAPSIQPITQAAGKPKCSCAKPISDDEVSPQLSRTEVSPTCSRAGVCTRPKTTPPAAQSEDPQPLAPCGRPRAESETLLSPSQGVIKCPCGRGIDNREPQYDMREMSTKTPSKCPCKESQSVQPIAPPEELAPCGRPKAAGETLPSTSPSQGAIKCPCGQGSENREPQYDMRGMSTKTTSKCPCKESQSVQPIAPPEELAPCGRPIEDKQASTHAQYYPSDAPTKCPCVRADDQSEHDIPQTSPNRSAKCPCRKSDIELEPTQDREPAIGLRTSERSFTPTLTESQQEADQLLNEPPVPRSRSQLSHASGQSLQVPPPIPAPRLNLRVSITPDTTEPQQKASNQSAACTCQPLNQPPVPARRRSQLSNEIASVPQVLPYCISSPNLSLRTGSQQAPEVIVTPAISEPLEGDDQTVVHPPPVAPRSKNQRLPNQSVSTPDVPASAVPPRPIYRTASLESLSRLLCICGREEQNIRQDRLGSPAVCIDLYHRDISPSTCTCNRPEDNSRMPVQESPLICCHRSPTAIVASESDPSVCRDEAIIVITGPDFPSEFYKPRTNIHQSPLRYPTRRGQVGAADREPSPCDRIRSPFPSRYEYSGHDDIQSSAGYSENDFPLLRNLAPDYPSSSNAGRCSCRNDFEFSSQTVTPATYLTDTSLLSASGYQGMPTANRADYCADDVYYSLSSSDTDEIVTVIECPALMTKSSAYKTPETNRSQSEGEEEERGRTRNKKRSRERRSRSESASKNMAILQLLNEAMHLINEESSVSDTSSALSKQKIRNIGTFGDRFANVGAFSSGTNLSGINITIIPNGTELTELPSNALDINCSPSCDIFITPNVMQERSPLPENCANVGIGAQSFDNWDSGAETLNYGMDEMRVDEVDMQGMICMCMQCPNQQNAQALAQLTELQSSALAQESNTVSKVAQLSQTPIEIRTEIEPSYDYVTDGLAEEEFMEMVSEYEAANSKEKSKAAENEKTECDCCHCRSVRSGMCSTVALSKQTLDNDDSSKEMKYFIDSMIMDLDAMAHARKQRLCQNTAPNENCQTVAARSFPVTIIDVAVLGSASLYIKWCIHDCCGVGGYEIYVDGHLTNRYFNYYHEAAVICDVDIYQPHKIVLVAQPKCNKDYSDFSKDDKSEKNRSLAINSTETPRTVWTPSIYYYDPVENQ